MRVVSEIDIVEVDGREPGRPVGQKAPTMIVRSHWNKEGLVVLEVGDLKVTVSGSDLLRSVMNARNSQ